MVGHKTITSINVNCAFEGKRATQHCFHYWAYIYISRENPIMYTQFGVCSVVVTCGFPMHRPGENTDMHNCGDGDRSFG